MKLNQYLTALSLVALSNICLADGVFQVGYADGGDKVGEVILQDEDGDLSSQDVTYGSGFNLGIGGVFDLSELLEIQSTFNYKEDAVRAKNGSASFKRMPIDALLFFKGEHFRAGLGFVYELNPKSSGFDYDSKCDNATGTAFELGYKWTSFAVGVRSTRIEYDCRLSAFGESFSHTESGNNTAIQGTWRF